MHLDELYKRIEHILSATRISDNINALTGYNDNVNRETIKKWNEEQVKQWLLNNNLNEFELIFSILFHLLDEFVSIKKVELIVNDVPTFYKFIFILING